MSPPFGLPVRGARVRRAGTAFLLLLPLLVWGCGREITDALPFFPPSKYVDVGGRKLKRDEVAYYQKIKDLSTATKINPSDAVAYNTLGELFQIKGNFDLAKELYVKASSLDPTLSESQHNLGAIAIQEGLYGDALINLQRAVKLSPDDARIRHRIGQAHAGQGQVAEALKAYDEAIKLDNEYTPAHLDKARLLYARQRYKEAEAACRQAIANLPKKVPGEKAKETRGAIWDTLFPGAADDEKPPDTSPEEARYDLALCLKAQGRLSEALASLPPAEKAHPGRADVQILRSRLQEGLGDVSGASATLEALREEFPEMAELPKRLSRLYQKSGDAARASKTRLEAAELDHSDRQLQLEAARAAAALKDVPRQIAVYERLVRMDPEDLESRRALAKAYDDAGIKRQAAFTWQEVVNRSATDMAARRRLGVLYASLPGFQGRAVLQFKAVLVSNPNDQEVQRLMGELHLNARGFDEAEKHLRKAIALNPKDAAAHLMLGVALAETKRGEDAAVFLRKALELDPTLTDAHLRLARTQLSVDHREEAVAPLEAYLKAKPLDDEARRLYAGVLRDLNRREEAVQEYTALAALHPQDVATGMELAKLSILLGKRDDAAGMYEALLEKHPANTEALRATGRLYDGLKQPWRAMYCWQRLLKLQPNDQEAQARLAAAYKAVGADEEAIARYEALGHADAWRNAAFLRLKRGETALAAAAYRKVVELEKRDAEARHALAGILQRSGDSADKDEAIKLYHELIQLNPKDARARLNLGNLFLDRNRWPDAQEQYEALLRADPNHVAARVGLGVVFRKKGKTAEALEQYELALKTDPNARLAHYNLGLLYDYYLEDAEKARLHYDRFLALGGDKAQIPEPESAAPPAPSLDSGKKGPKEPAKAPRATLVEELQSK